MTDALSPRKDRPGTPLKVDTEPLLRGETVLDPEHLRLYPHHPGSALEELLKKKKKKVSGEKMKTWWVASWGTDPPHRETT